MYITLFGKALSNSRPGRCLVLIAAGSVAAPVFAAETCEQIAGYSCEYEVEQVDLQKVPPFFKFQTRISQAKLPVGDVIFEQIYVNVKRGDTPLCQETFSQVPVRDSVLNLEIGRTMDCELGTTGPGPRRGEGNDRLGHGLLRRPRAAEQRRG